MDWKSLPAFLAVARSGSLRAGAAEIGGTHATVRRQIEGLEAQLGATLFRRAAGGLTLNAAGRRFLPQALEAEEALKNARASGTRGRITREAIDSAAAVFIAERFLTGRTNV